MTNQDLAIARGMLWFAEQLEERFRVRAAYSIMAIAHPSEGDYTRHTALVECAEVIKETRELIRKQIPDV